MKRAEEGALVDSVGEREWAVDLLEGLTSGLGTVGWLALGNRRARGVFWL